jgi:hypothetical protein
MNNVWHFIWVAKLIYCEFFNLKFHISWYVLYTCVVYVANVYIMCTRHI